MLTQLLVGMKTTHFGTMCSRLSALAGAASVLAACSGGPTFGPQSPSASLTITDPVATAAIDKSPAASNQRTMPTAGETLAELTRRNAENPRDVATALRYARHLKAAAKPSDALAVLDKAEDAGNANPSFLAEHGLLSLQLGDTRKAQQILAKAAPETTKDWRVPSGLGVALATLGKQAEAQKHLKRALELSPGNPLVLNNLAMSNLLERKLDQAETLLKTARGTGTQRPHVSENLKLAMALKAGPGIADREETTEMPHKSASNDVTPPPAPDASRQ